MDFLNDVLYKGFSIVHDPHKFRDNDFILTENQIVFGKFVFAESNFLLIFVFICPSAHEPTVQGFSILQSPWTYWNNFVFDSFVLLQKVSLLSWELTILLEEKVLKLFWVFKLFVREEFVEIFGERFSPGLCIVLSLQVYDGPKVFLRQQRNDKSTIIWN